MIVYAIGQGFMRSCNRGRSSLQPGPSRIAQYLRWGSDRAESANINMLAHRIGPFWLLNTPFRGQNGAFKIQTSVDSRQQADIDDQMSGCCSSDTDSSRVGRVSPPPRQTGRADFPHPASL